MSVSNCFLSDAQLKKLAEEREEAAELRSMAKRDAAKEYAVKLDANEKKLKQVPIPVPGRNGSNIQIVRERTAKHFVFGGKRRRSPCVFFSNGTVF